MDKKTRELMAIAAASAYFELPLIINEYDELVMPRDDGAAPDRYATLDYTPKKVIVLDSRDRKLFTIICHDET